MNHQDHITFEWNRHANQFNYFVIYSNKIIKKPKPPVIPQKERKTRQAVEPEFIYSIQST